MTPSPDRGFLLLNQQRKQKISVLRLRTFVDRLEGDLGLQNLAFSVVFVSDETIRRFNRDYRRFDKATDVLSFRGDPPYLGDIVISSETAQRQAESSRTLTFETNLHRLILHGLLHLMGYDHETDHGEMRNIERRFRRRFKC
jgi:probable rRNA maturation factor